MTTNWTRELKKLPNQITLSRIIFTLITYYFVINFDVFWFTTFFIIAGFTDVLDGHLARLMKLQSSFGSKLDTIADNFLHYSIIFWIYILYPDIIYTYLSWLIVLLGLVHIYMVSSLIKHKQYFGLHTFHNKFNSFLLFLFMLSLIYFGFYEPLVYFLFASTYIAYISNIYHLYTKDKIILD